MPRRVHELINVPCDLHAARAALDLSQIELAQRLAVSPQTVHRWEKQGSVTMLVAYALRGLMLEITSKKAES